jgi:predicted XRE-type DNA-binding protein
MSTQTDRPTYNVQAKRWARGWELDINGVGVTQSRTLNDAEAMVRDYIALDTGVPADSFNVEIVPEVGNGLDGATRAARRAVAEAEKAQRAAASLSRDVAHRLNKAGLSGREIAVVLSVSPQRVSQLLKNGATGKIGSAARTTGRARLAVKASSRKRV